MIPLRRLLCVVVCLVLLTQPVLAADYAQASWPNIMRTLVRFNAINLADNALLDEYAIITECELYKLFYRDDFKWNKIRKTILDSIRINVATFPTAYTHKIPLQLDRYDFKDKIFRFTDKTAIRNINTIVMYETEGTSCGNTTIKHMPRAYRAVMDAPLYFEGLPLAQKDAQALLTKMDGSGNTDRLIYAAFNVRVTYIEPMRKSVRVQEMVEEETYTQSNAPDTFSMRIDVHLDSIDFYQDKAMTKLIYHFQT